MIPTDRGAEWRPGLPAIVSLHPATWLLVWAGVVLLLQSLGWRELAVVAPAALGGAFWLARHRTAGLIRRARWLLLTIAILFSFATPGQRLPGATGDLGVTLDGVVLAVEHVLRLVGVLASLAIVHQRLGNEGVISGLHLLLAPLAAFGELRRRMVVRLLLVLEYVESAPGAGWRYWLGESGAEPSAVSLQLRALGAGDIAVAALLLVALIGAYR